MSLPTPLQESANEMKERLEESTTEKEWVPYTGPKGGEGWRSTVTQAVRYQPDMPEESTAPDIDEIGMDDIEEADIHGTRLWDTVDNVDELQVGYQVQYHDEEHDYDWEAHVKEIRDGSLILETEDLRQLEIDVDSDGNVEEFVRRQKMVYYGWGVAGSDNTWLPEDEPANNSQLAAEALRSAASIDDHYDLEPLESFVAIGIDRDEGMDRIEDVVEFALEKHPMLNPDQLHDVVEAGWDKVEDLDIDDLEEEHDEITQTDMSNIEAAVKAFHKDADGSWLPYIGPQEGEGWRHTGSGEIVYQPEAPGQVGTLEEAANPTLGIDVEDVERDDYISIDGEVEGIVEMTDVVGGEVRITFDSGNTVRVSDESDLRIDDDIDGQAFRSQRRANEDVYNKVRNIPIEDWPNSAWMEPVDVYAEMNGMFNRAKEGIAETFLDDFNKMRDRSSRSGYSHEKKIMQFRPDAGSETLMHELGHAVIGSQGYNIDPAANGFAYFYGGEYPDFEEGEDLSEVFTRMIDRKIQKLRAQELFPGASEGDVSRLKEKKEHAREKFEGKTVEMDMFHLQLEDGAEQTDPDVEHLIDEVNAAWERQRDAGQADEDLDDYVIGGSYSAMNAHETIAMLHEELQADTADPQTAHNLLENHGTLLLAYVEVFSAGDIQKQVINSVWQDMGPTEEFEDIPFPEVQ